MRMGLLPLLFLLGACALTPRDTGKAFLFALPPVTTAVTTTGAALAVSDSLIVALPVAAPELDTYRIALIRKDGRRDYYAGAKWVEFLPLLVQASLTETLKDAKLYKTVATDQSGLAGSRVLKAEIGAFQAEYAAASAPVVKITMSVSLLDRFKRIPSAAFDIRVEEKAAADRLPEIQAAFAKAFAKAQKQIVQELDRVLP